MLNKYPLWKNLLILLVAVLGFVYSIPNLYEDDEAILLTNESFEISESDVNIATTALEAAQVNFFGMEINDGNMIVRVDTVDDQLRAKTALEEAFTSDYIVALNLAPTTPAWMQSLGAKKMARGLDLQGGVHFLMEVDMEAAIERRMQDNLSAVRSILREERIRSRAQIADDNRLEVAFNSSEDRSRARSEFIDNFPEMQFQNREVGESFVLDMILTPDTILQIQRDTLQANRTTLMNRVDELGVAEPTVQQQGADRIVVELPGVQDPAQAIRILQRIATLQFHLTAQPGSPRSSYETYEYVTPEGTQIVDVSNDVILQGDRISNAVSGIDEYSQPQVSITLDAQGGNQINRVTRDNVGWFMDILLIETKSRTNLVLNEDGEEVEETEFYEEKRLISHAQIQTALGRQFRITGLTPREANDTALLIRAGSLSAPMTIVEQSVIGPSLGAENLQAGFTAVQVAAVLVVLFMLFYYRVFGLAANAALILNILLIFTVMSAINATLTLPGIVGIVLTVGMAVDANVLIFTRIREELANGAPPQRAIDEGYNNAFSTILDANVTTFLVALVLFTIGTGPVRGFSVTLMIGIVTSMFTAIVGTRALINLIYGGKKVKTLSIGKYASAASTADAS
ncbi:MAG: protein translocase subunit SecD [Proteobacteria bacterium]|nr:protein translocase subunit SecD [Pseudomonadota bacterium]